MAHNLRLRVSDQFVSFPERVVTLAYGTQAQLSGSLDLLPIAELRRAKELATEYVELSPPREQREIVEEAASRLVPPAKTTPLPFAYSTLA